MDGLIEVAGIWEVGWNVPIIEALQWEMMLREFNINQLNMTPISGISAPWGSQPWISEYNTIEDLIVDKPNLTPVFVDESAEKELHNFIHPKNALYIFGKVGKSPKVIEGASSVKISTPMPGCLWAHQACAIILYDRFRK